MNIKKPPILIKTILPALKTGKATDADNVSKDNIKKYEENKLGTPTAKPVKTCRSSHLVSYFFCIKKAN